MSQMWELSAFGNLGKGHTDVRSLYFNFFVDLNIFAVKRWGGQRKTELKAKHLRRKTIFFSKTLGSDLVQF